MDLPHTLAFVGPLLAGGGAALTAYDMVRGQLRATVRRLFENQGRLLSEPYLNAVARYRELPEDHACREEWIREAQAQAKGEIDSAIQTWRQFEEKEQEVSFRFGIRGLVLIAIGSVCQSLPALMSS